MAFSEPSPRVKRSLRWLGWASSLLFVFSCFLPTEPPRRYTTIEDSWVQALHLAFLHHLQFGREIVFTYGPWGFLYGSYRPETHFISVLVWLALAIVFWWAAQRVARVSFQNELGRWAWVMAVTSLTGISIFLNIDPRLVCWPLLLLLLYFFDEKPGATPVQVAVIISMGLLSLVKFTGLIQNGAIILVIAADTVWRKRRVPWSAVWFAGSVFLFWLMAGQALSSFAPYLRHSWEITSGYTEAMMETGPEEMKYVAWFVLVALIVIVAAAFVLWKRLRFFGVLPLGALAFTIFTIFKYGFVRDDGHEATAAILLLLVALMCLAMAWPVVRERPCGFKVAIFLPLVAAYVFTACSFHRFAEPPFTKQLVETLSPQKWAAPFQLIYNGETLRKQWEQYLEMYRNEFPLPPLKGDTDSYSWNQMQLFARDLPYRPRPVLQSYSAYTPGLAEINAAHLRSDHAAQTILFDNFSLDRRYNSLNDALSWPELLTRYDVQQVEFPFIVLERSTTPRKYTFTPLGETTMKFGEQLSLPPLANSPLWAKIEIDRTAAGSLVFTLFKPPVLTLKTTLANGQQNTNRFVPAMARAGFVLSPFVRDCSSFAALASTNWPNELAENAVTRFSIVPEGDATTAKGYRDAIHVTLFRLDYPRQDLEAVAGYHQMIQLKEDSRRITRLRTGNLIYLPGEDSVLAVSPRSAILLSRPKDSTRLRVGFGLFSGGQQTTNSVTFRVSGSEGGPEGMLLWSHRLEPSSISGDRGKQEMIIELNNPKMSQILLETLPDTEGALHPYWFEMHFE